MINHVWGLLTHPDREWKLLHDESETVTQHYARHVLLLAAVPVICTYIGTTQVGWNFGDGKVIPLAPTTAFFTAIVFYLLILGAVVVMGNVIYWMAHRYTPRPSRNRCIVFAGYIATPMFLSGLVALYPLIWLCLLAGTLGLCYTAYLLYWGIPNFLDIDRKEGFIVSSSTLGIGVLVLEALLAITVLLWGYGSRLV